MITKSLPKARKRLESRDNLMFNDRGKKKRNHPVGSEKFLHHFLVCGLRLKITSDPSGKTSVLSKRIRKLPHDQVVEWRESDSWRKTSLAGLYIRTLISD